MKKYILFALILASSLDLWSQVPTYKWVSGSQSSRERSILFKSTPGPREGASTFTDSEGNYWLFGGRGSDLTETQGILNDLWKYDRNASTWIWESGSMVADKALPEYNNALSFDGIDDAVALETSPVDYFQSFTAELWFKTTDNGPLLSFSPFEVEVPNEGWTMSVINNNQIRISKFSFNEVARFSTKTLTDNQWHHVALAKVPEDENFINNALSQRQAITVYVDGERIGYRETPFSDGQDPGDNHTTVIGAEVNEFDTAFFKGQIDELRFWHRALNDGEIQSLYAIELTGQEEGLGSYYNFNQQEANSAKNTELILFDLVNGINGNLNTERYRPGVFIGEMAEVRVWSSALNETEIKNLSESTVNGSELNLALAYDFNVGTANGDNTAVPEIPDLTTSNSGFFNNLALQGESSNLSEGALHVGSNYILSENEARALIPADLNGDTYIDAITANHSPQSINVFINDQAGNLGMPVSHDVGSYPKELATGLLNGDAFPDVAVAAFGVTSGDERVRIFYGDGTGGFSSFSDLAFPIDSEPSQIEISDINGDTFQDLVVLLAGETRVEIHYGDGTGAFPTTYSFDLIGEYYNEGFIIDDFTNDGFPDIATTVILSQGSCREIGFHENDQAGGFLPGTYYPLLGCLNIVDMESADFNNDGNLDIVFSDNWTIGSIIGNGDGTFKEGEDLISNNTDYFISDFTVADINGDLQEDLIITSDEKVILFTGDGNGNFTETSKLNVSYATEDIFGADIDKNGFTDFVVAHDWDRLTLIKREADFFQRNTNVRTLALDGEDDFLDIPNLKVFDNSFTWEGWIKTEGNGPIFSYSNQDPSTAWQGGDFSLAIKDYRLAFIVAGYPDIHSFEPYNFTDGEWHHVAMAVEFYTGIGENEVVRFYIDGFDVGYFSDYDFDAIIDNTNGAQSAKLGYASGDFFGQLGFTGLSQNSNWVDGASFPSDYIGRSFAAEWSDNTNLYVFGGEGADGIYNSLWTRSIEIVDCPSVTGMGYTYFTTNSTRGPEETNGVGTIGGNGDIGYTFTDASFGLYDLYFDVGDVFGPRFSDICTNPSYEGSEQFNFNFSLQSPVDRSPDGTSITFTWLSDLGVGGTTTITLDQGVWPEITPIDKNWILASGTNTPNDPGDYGIKNVPASTNLPSARFATEAAVDANGNAWVFGGAANSSATDFLNDLWMYNTITKEWTWVSGSSTTNGQPEYGSKGTPSVSNIPGARSNHNIWIDNEGSIWIFGGFGYDANGTTGQLNDLWKFDPATLAWTWISGDELTDQGGVYGTIGMYSSQNKPGGRASAEAWLDSNGIAWIFAGSGLDKFGISNNYLNDLWSYDPVLNQWAWHSGSDFSGSTGSYNETGLSSTDYVPGARWHAASWIDEVDNLWLFGGYKYNQLSTGLYNDFWKYETTSNEWTWLSGYGSTAKSNQLGTYTAESESGSKPHPGSRHGGLSWTDNEGNFWLLGGAEIGNSFYGFYNDLWKYELSKDQWTYIRGNTELSLNEGVYGSKGIGSDQNIPRSRWHGASWTGKDGKLWFFGGINNNEAIGDIGWLNDLWYFDPSTETYTWMGGSTTIDAPAVYGIKGQPSVSHISGAKSSTAYWTDEEGMFWMFGGYESFEYNNDLWKFNPNTLEWTWVSGNNFQNSPTVYGEKGVPSPNNSIGARRYMDGRIDQNGIAWVFGGDGHDGQGQRGLLNDLWKYDPVTNIWTWVSGNTTRNSLGNYGTKFVAHPDNMPPPRYSYSSWIDDSGNYWLFGGYGDVDGDGPSIRGNLNDLWKFDVKTSLWTWMGGTDEVNNDGFVGPQGIFSESTVIPAKARALTFEKKEKSLFMFGGRNGPSFNDFWQIKFTPGLPSVEDPRNILQESFAFTSDEAWTLTYQVQIDLSQDFANPFYDVTSSNPESMIEGLQPGTIYYYRVNAMNDIGNSGFTVPKSVLTLPATPAFDPAGAAITNLTQSEATLNWQVTPGILDGYYLDISRDQLFADASLVHEDYDAKIIPVSEVSQISNLVPGTRYFVRMRSFNTSGESTYSEVVSFLTRPETPTYSAETVVSENTQSSALLTWNPVQEIFNGYRLTVSTLDDGFTDAAAFLADYNNLNLNKDRTSIRINGLQPGTQYFGRLVAFNNSGESVPAETVLILTTPASPVFNIDTAIQSISESDVTFSWEAPEGFFEGYYLELSTDFSFANTNLMLPGYGRGGVPFQLPSTDLATTVASLNPGQEYYARIKAYNSAGLSPNSNILTILTVPRAPSLGAANNVTQTSASLNWQGVQGADIYMIDLNISAGFEPENSVLENFPLAVPFLVLSDLSPGIHYYARVQSTNGSGNSGEMDPPDYGYTDFTTIPGTPVLNEVDSYTQDSFTISWAAVTGATAYEVDVSDNFFQTFLVGYNAQTVDVPQITVSGLEPGEEYQIRVRAKNASGKSPNAGNFDLLTIPETPIARDATNFSSRVFTANWDPAAGAEYYVLEVSTDNFNTFHFNEILTSSNPVQMTDLAAGATYRYRVRSGNASGESPNSNTITIVAQNSSQSLNINSVNFAETIDENTASTVVSVSVGGGATDPTVNIRHKALLGSQWSDLKPMTAISATSFEFEITASMMDDIGVEFEIYANDGITFVEDLGNVIQKSFSESNSESLPTLRLGEWQMISIPYVLDDNLVTSIFNELGQLQYKKQWRLMSYLNNAYQDQGVGFTRIELGRGYWFNSLSDVVINVGAGKTNSAVPYVMPLEQGWNQIGNPYNVPINWSAIVRENNLVSVVDDLLIFDKDAKEFTNADVLNPFEGAFVWADAGTTISINPQTTSSGRIAAPSQVFGDGDWKMEFSLNWEDKSRKVAGFGMHQDAESSKDKLDKVTIPRFVNYLEMFTYHENFFYPYFSYDFVPQEDTYQWSFKLASNVLTGVASLSWENFSLPEGYLWLVDEVSGEVISMTATNNHTFSYSGERDFTVHYSLDPAYEALPKRIIVQKVYPNPTSGMAQVELSLPDATHLNLQLFDLQGKMVKSIANGIMHAGKHVLSLNVDENSIPDGFYVLKVTADGKNVPSADQKIIIRR